MNGIVSSRRGLVGPTLAMLAAFAVLVALGVWQLERKVWKENLIATMDARLAAPPVDLPPPEQWGALNPDNAEFRRVKFRAEFIPVDDVYVYVAGSALRTDIQDPGYFVFRPAKLPDGHVVVVNRGYIPIDAVKQSPAETLDIAGYIRFPEPKPWFISATAAPGQAWFVRDQRAMAAARGWGEVAPFYVDQETPVPPGGLPRPSALVVTLRDDHLGYALTWFGLAAVLAGVYIAWLVSRRRDKVS